MSDCKHTEDVGVVCSDKRIPGFKFINTMANNVQVNNLPSIKPALDTKGWFPRHRLRLILDRKRTRLNLCSGNGPKDIDIFTLGQNIWFLTARQRKPSQLVLLSCSVQ